MKRYNDEPMGVRSAIGIAVITAIFMLIVVINASIEWSDADTYARNVYGIILSISGLIEVRLVYLLRQYYKEG